KAKLRRRGKRSLGWVPFKNQTVRVVGSIVHFNGRKVRLWLAPRNRGTHQVRIVLAGCPRALVLQHRDRVLPKPHGKNVGVGIDLGLKDGMVLSTGRKVENSRVFARYEAELVVAQRANKARRVAAIHAKIANTRKDFLHNVTTKIADAF